MIARKLFLSLLASGALFFSGCAAVPVAAVPDPTPPIVFMHGNGDSAALWQTTIWRFESNGWPASRLHAVEVPYPLARDVDAKPQPGRTSAAENMAYLKSEIDQVLKATGAAKVILIGNSRGGNAIRSYVESEMKSNGKVNVSIAILGGTPNHGVWAIPGFREDNEFSGTGPYLTALNAPKNAAGDEVTGPVRWMTMRSDNNDKFAQPDGAWVGLKDKATNIPYEGPELKGAYNVVIPGVDHRETAYGPAAFAAMYRFITGKEPASPEIKPESPVTLSGEITGLGVQSDDPKSGNFSNNLPLPGAKLEIFAVDADGARTGPAAYSKTVGTGGAWGPFATATGGPFEFVITAPGYAITHIYRSAFPRSSSIVDMHPERMSDADKAFGAQVILTRPRGYLDPKRDKMSLDGNPPPGLAPPAAGTGAGIATSKLTILVPTDRAVTAEFNGERVTGRIWPAVEGNVVYLEMTK